MHIQIFDEILRMTPNLICIFMLNSIKYFSENIVIFYEKVNSSVELKINLSRSKPLGWIIIINPDVQVYRKIISTTKPLKFY